MLCSNNATNWLPLKVKTPLCGGVGFLWLVRDSNPRRLSRLIYSQIPLAAWVTSQMHPRPPVISRTNVLDKFSRINLGWVIGAISTKL